MRRKHIHEPLRWGGMLAAVLLAGGLTPDLGRGAADQQLLVVFDSGVRPFSEAVEGLRAGLRNVPGPLFIDLRSGSWDADVTEALQRASPRLVITVGMEALGTVAGRNSPVPILATMVLRSDSTAGVAASPARRMSGIYLDVPVSDVMSELKTAFPNKNRLGVIRNPSRQGRPDTNWQARARQQGFTLQVAECSRPEDLLRSFLSLKGKADFILLLPDSSLYNDATVRPLILASLENHLPIIGFSASFVRAGAAVGIYPDFRDIGLQTAEAALRYLSAPAGLADEGPRKLVIALNQRVARLLGLEHQAPPNRVMTIK